MSSIADLPELVGFFSYSREDDDAFKGTLSALRDSIQRELSAQLGRSKTTFRLWQDQVAIAPGKLWESEIKTAIDESFFFIPIVTPRSVYSKYCKFEFESFLTREKAIGRSDLVFPILYITVAALENEAKWRDDPVLSTIGRRQYVDWRPLRHLDAHSTAVRERVESLCQKIVEALNAPSPEERRKMEEAKAQQQTEEEARRLRTAEEEQRSKQAEARKRAEEESKRQKAEAERRVHEEERRKRAEAEAPLAAKDDLDRLLQRLPDGGPWTGKSKRDFPYIVDTIIPERGFEKQLNKMSNWYLHHGTRGPSEIKLRDENKGGRSYMRWYFTDHATARRFAAAFGGTLEHVPRPPV
jgi:hypothetical protein